ncbi:MAG: hypothetical protein JKX83_02495 [Pseudomonadales bacterium]|nr:hypothetical protein [Pseudomonadales bacterium]
MSPLLKKIIRLPNRLIGNPRQNVILFMVGSSVFFTGLGLILVAGQFMPESEVAEWVALLGLMVLGIGALMAFIYYVGILWSRISGFWFRD